MEEVKKVEKSSSDVEENKVMAAISYLGILFLIPLLAKKDSAYAQYHAKQGMILFIFEVLFSFVSMIPLIGWFVIMPIGSIISLVLLVMGLINALSGQTKPLPLIGSFADKFQI